MTKSPPFIKGQKDNSVKKWVQKELLPELLAKPQLQEKQLTLLSLFCGPGGLDQGFKDANFLTELAFDIDQEAVNTFRANHLASRAYVRDITQLSLNELDNLYGGIFSPDGVIGGPPCQSFSFSNVHQSDDDPRHKLPESYAALLKRLNERHPLSFFLFENVLGLLGKKHKYKYELFKKLFQEAGFTIYEQTLDAKNYGVPQERPRIFIVGINYRKHPNKKWVPPQPENVVKTVRETIGNLPEPVYFKKGLNPDEFPIHPNHWCLVPKSDKFKSGNLKEGQMIGRSFRTLWWDKPSWTVAYGHREVHVHPNGHRRLSIYEAMLLQTFPENYRLTGTLSAQIRLVSEAVPVILAWRIAQSIRESLGI
ncbi:DNA cytosine methyltransferase [candidate division KSB1 bacterium]|nr:DNA cytosine methyltransferase [candidate division KSB1 bacterium]